MALFNFGKKREETKTPACCSHEIKAEESKDCCGSAPSVISESICCGEKAAGVCCFKVLGAGCKSCHDQYEYAKAAITAIGLIVEVEYITDMEKVMAYGVMSILESIRAGYVSYIINTRAILSGVHYEDGVQIRRCAVENGVTMSRNCTPFVRQV